MQWMQGYMFYLLIGSAFAFYLSAAAFPYRKMPGRRYFWVLMLSAGFAILFTTFELAAQSTDIKLAWRNAQQAPLFACGVFIFAMSRDYVDQSAASLRKKLYGLGAFIATYVALILTDPYHHLMRSSIGLETVGKWSEITVQPTILNTAFIVCNQVICLYSVLLLALNMRNTPRHYRRQHLLLLLGILLPVVLVLLLPALHLHILGFSSVIFLPSGILFYYALFREQMLSIWPIAKDKIYLHMKDGILLTDRYDAIVDMNPSAERLLTMLCRMKGVPPIQLGQGIAVLYQGHPELEAAYARNQETTVEMVFALSGSKTLSYEVSLIPIGDQKTMNTGKLMIFSDQTEQKRHERELIRQATTDELTGICNRRHFLRLVREQLAEKDDVALLLLDIDDFKVINDTYGHQSGDLALVEFAGKMISQFGHKGIIGRMGGEEFAVCLPGISELDSLDEAMRFQRRLGKQPIALLDGHAKIITTSIGTAYAATAGAPFEELYQQADKALYVSKRSGKNKTTKGQPLSPRAHHPQQVQK